MSSDNDDDDDDNFSSNDDSNDDDDDDEDFQNDEDDEVMNQRQVRRPASRGATPRALTGRTTKSSSSPTRRKQQRRQQYTAAEIDREIAGGRDDSDDDSSSNGGQDSNDDDDDDNDDIDIDHATNKRVQSKGKAKQPTVATPKKRTRKSGYKPITKKPKMKSAKQMKASKPKQRRMESSDEESEEEEDYEDDENFNEEDESEEEDNDSDSDYGTSSKKTPTRGKKASGYGASGTRGTRSTSTRTTETRSSSARNRQSLRHRSNSFSNSSDDNDDDDDEDDYMGQSGGGRGRGRGGRPRRACKTQTELRMSEMVHKDMQSEKEAWRGVLEEDDRELLGMEAGRGNNDDEDDDDDDDSRNVEDNDVVNEKASSTTTGKKRATPKKGSIPDDDDDEDYDEEDNPSDANEDDDDDAAEDDVVSDDELISQQNQRRSCRNGQKTKNVDLSDEEIGTADEDSEDEETGPGILMSPARKASASRMGGTYYDGMGSSGRSPNASKSRARARMGREPLNVHDGDEDEEEEDDSHGHVHQSTSPHSATTSSTGKKSMEVAMASHINCPSTTDDITMANLPRNKPHVCYISPDGKTRHCFALDTLYRIAISAASNRIGGDGGSIDGNNHGSAQKLTFLQPPHFRSPMEDDLLDQIASRFGRAALIIEKSAIYKKMHGSIFSLNDDDELDDFDEDGEFIGYTNNNYSSRRGNFQDRFERFIQGLMGSNDVYCCPLCYKEADRRLGNMGDEEMCEDDADDDDEDETEEGHQHSGEECFSFMDDPMRILGSLDQDQYEVASTFCFRTLMDVKTHLKVVHQANIKEVYGNDLYHRFQIRASDGLLQSWLKRNLGKSTVQGDMMRYWSNGENQSFVLLLSQIEKRRYEGEISDEYGIDFCQSFPNRARRVWREVSAPYSKDQHDMGDFIAAEGEEEESEEDDDVGPSCLTPHDAHAEGENLKSPEDQMIEFLQKKQKSNRQKQSFLKRKANSSDEGNSSDASSSDDDELEVLPKPQQFEDVEEEDEWTKSKSLKAKKGQMKTKSTSRSDDDSGDANVFGSDMEVVNPETKSNGSARKRVIDDDNSLGSDTDRNKSDCKSPANYGGSARKKVIESSDEDSF
ncbi:hypothetical protein ACHAWU_010225 [Discostella pseudostelligera]|uniref:Uncharacterized protein n=1 Tax=Discostella pseudostelligera TaxID=259834 RepID=A0ABD3MCJ4_9STRA